MTSAPPPTRSPSTSATCGARPRRAASRGCCTPCAASATSCARTDAVTLGRRLTLLCALAVGATVVLACAGAYVLVRGELRGQIDDSLRGQARALQVRAGVAPDAP